MARSFLIFAARLKSCADTNQQDETGRRDSAVLTVVKAAVVRFGQLSGRLKDVLPTLK
jgi:hypothetical protein